MTLPCNLGSSEYPTRVLVDVLVRDATLRRFVYVHEPLTNAILLVHESQLVFPPSQPPTPPTNES